MAKNTCNICGGNLIYKNGKWVCDACGAYAVEEITNEENTNFYAANQKLRLSNFEEAEELYSDIIRQYPNNAYGYWGLLKAQYGIIYEKDYDGKMIPSCYNTTYESLYDNQNYLKAYELGDDDQKVYFKDQAEKIEKVRKEWIDIASKEKPYDIFLSYKASEIVNGIERKTDDYSDAHDIYNALTSLGYRVFFSKVSLQGKTGEKYEPYIFNALNTSKVMIVYSSKIEYTNATWVRNEYLRYDKRIKKGEKLKNSLILIYKDFNPSELSKPLKDIQNLNRDDINFMDNLRSYLDKVMNESKKQFANINRVQIKEIEVKENKKINIINKLKLKNKITKQERIDIKKVETRDIGKNVSNNFNADNTQQIKVAYTLLNRQLFKDSELYFDKILEQSKNNKDAMIGKILSHQEITNIDDLFNCDFNDFDNLDLLFQVIEYSSKEDAQNYLKKLIEITFNLIESGNFKKAYKIYSNIADYNLNFIQNNHIEIMNSVIKHFDQSKECFDIINLSLKFIISNKSEYSKMISRFISKLIEFKIFDLSKKYYDDAKKILYDDFDFLILKYSIQEKESNINDAIFKYIKDNKNLSKEIESMDYENANKLLNLFSKSIISNVGVSSSFNFKTIEENVKILANYDFDGNNNFIESLLKIIISNPNENSNDLFEFLILQRYADDIEGLSSNIILYAKGYLNNNDFINAKKYCEFGLNYNQRNIDLLILLFQVNIHAITFEDISNNINQFNDYELLERILFTYNDELKRVEFLDKLCSSCVVFIKNNKSEKEPFDFFDKIIRYYSESFNSNLLNSLENFANALKEVRKFDDAEKYYLMIVNVDKNQYRAYWGLLQVHLKCINNDELIHQKVYIADTQEFKNALFSSCNDQDVLNTYIDCRIKQEKWLKGNNRDDKNSKAKNKIKQEKNKVEKPKNKIKQDNIKVEKPKNIKSKKAVKVILGLSISVICVAGGFVAYTFFIKDNNSPIIPDSNQVIRSKYYYEAAEYINRGNYLSASDYIDLVGSKAEYEVKYNLKLLSQAGIAFNSDQVHEGMRYIQAAGGTMEVYYDANGGKSSKSKDTFKQNQKETENNNTVISTSDTKWSIDNDASKDGYDFNKWSVKNFSIKVNEGQYSSTINLYANYSIIKYMISYILNGGECSNPYYYNVESETFTLNNPIKEGYTFIGWSGTDIEGYSTSVTIKKGSIGKRKYKANFVEN